MIKQSPYRNIFVYFRGAQVNQNQDRQIEDNITKSLINLFEHSDRKLLEDFLKSIGIIVSPENIVFDIQVANFGSRPDALIRTNECDIYIESKYEAPFNEEQLQNHLKNTNGYLLYISKQKYKEEIKQKYYSKKVIFINWFDIADFLIKLLVKNTYPENTITYFLSRQFIGFMEELNMIPFNGWKNRDFESFLSIENENKRETEQERKRVKEKLEQFLNELKEKIESKSDFYKNCQAHIGNLDNEHGWGAIKFCDGSLIDQIHVSVIINAYNFSIGIQIEGKNPTTKAIKLIKHNKEKFLGILKKLTHFNYFIRERYQIRVRNFESKIVAQIALGVKITIDDVDYIIKKMEQYELVELRIVRILDKHEAINKGQGFIKECADILIITDEMMQFLR